MSLYSHEEICHNCQHAVFHECCGSFCRCTIKSACADHGCGTCLDKKLKEPCDCYRCRVHI